MTIVNSWNEWDQLKHVIVGVAENSNITESQLTVDQVSLQPRTIGALTDYSRRLLLQSSIDIENLVRKDLATQIAIEIENQAINGVGTESKPLGILNVSGINTESEIPCCWSKNSKELLCFPSPTITIPAVGRHLFKLANAATNRSKPFSFDKRPTPRIIGEWFDINS